MPMNRWKRSKVKKIVSFPRFEVSGTDRDLSRTGTALTRTLRGRNVNLPGRAVWHAAHKHAPAPSLSPPCLSPSFEAFLSLVLVLAVDTTLRPLRRVPRVAIPRQQQALLQCRGHGFAPALVLFNLFEEQKLLLKQAFICRGQ